MKLWPFLSSAYDDHIMIKHNYLISNPILIVTNLSVSLPTYIVINTDVTRRCSNYMKTRSFTKNQLQGTGRYSFSFIRLRFSRKISVFSMICTIVLPNDGTSTANSFFTWSFDIIKFIFSQKTEQSFSCVGVTHAKLFIINWKGNHSLMFSSSHWLQNNFQLFRVGVSKY